MDTWLGRARRTLGQYESSECTEQEKKILAKQCNQKVTDVFWAQRKHHVGSGLAFLENFCIKIVFRRCSDIVLHHTHSTCKYHTAFNRSLEFILRKKNPSILQVIVSSFWMSTL